MLKDQIVGIIGGGQLGSMLCQAANKLNIKTVVISDDKNGPAQKFCDEYIFSDYTNSKNLKKFIDLVDVVTFEFENISYETLSTINKNKDVFPNPTVNKIIQNRKTEKTFINDLGLKTTPWAFVQSKKDIKNHQKLIPGILKTTILGYDGHGQHVINNLDDVKDEWYVSADYILEKLVKLNQEISVIITRFKNGKTIIYEPIENTHKNQILKNSKIPANISVRIFNQSQHNAKLIAEKLNYVGTMCVEYFIDIKGELLVNEIAPRVHNSGHLTINAFSTSQFENHIRAICDLDIVKLNKISNAKMINILGEEIEIYRERKLKKNEFFFDYLKKQIKKKRKMGHITTLTS